MDLGRTVRVSLRCGTATSLMSALGQKQTSDCRPLMSALPPKADVDQHDYDVRFVPILLQKSLNAER
jgi:hypothetical protein